MLKKILATALAAAMIFAMAGIVFAASPFPDTAGAANEAVIARLKALGIVKGDDLGNFNPNNPINRAEFTTMIVRMLGLEAAAGVVNIPTKFPDVTENFSWAYGYINVATNRNLIKGYEDGTFRPGNNVTQAEAITILLRAAGYSDNLPGDWPIDYMMQAATLGVIGTGFSANTAATRALIATLVNNTLDVPVVLEDPDHPGVFPNATGNKTVYETAFSVAAGADTVSGKVTGTSTTAKTITLEGPVVVDYVDGVQIYGKDTVGELVGQYVTMTLNKSGKAVFVAVTTKQEVVGEITAVNTVDLTVTVGGTAYEMATTNEVIKNGDAAAGDTAAKLVAVNGYTAKLFLNSDGEVYRIEASKLDKKGALGGKTATIGTDGKTVYTITVTGTNAGTYTLPSTATVIRNGASAAFADLKTGDDLEFSAKSDNTLIYLDAFANVVEGYKVLSLSTLSTGVSVKTSKDGVETTFTLHKNYAGPALTLGNSYKFTLDRAGLVIDAALVTATGPVATKVKTIASKDVVIEADGTGVDHRFVFTDGSVVVLDTLVFDTDDPSPLQRNGVDITDQDTSGAVDYIDVWMVAQVGDMYWLAKHGDHTDPADPETGVTQDYTLELFAASVTGRVVHTLNSESYVLSDGTNDVAAFDATWLTPTTENGVAVLAASRPTQATPGVTTYTGTVTFGTTSETTKPYATGLTLEKFASATALPIASISTSGSTTTVVLEEPTADVILTCGSSTIVMKDGEKVTLADLKIGDKVLYDATTCKYIKAKTDKDAAKITYVDYDFAAGTVTVKFKLDEVVKTITITIEGTATTVPCESDGDYTINIAYATDPGVVNITVVDFAGNISSANAFAN